MSNNPISDSFQALGKRILDLEAAVDRMLSVPNDHMTACDRVMGDTHPCTCGADAARRLLNDRS